MSRIVGDLIKFGSEFKSVEVRAKYAPYPWKEILPNDHVVGELPEDAQKVFVLLSMAETLSQHAHTNLRRVAQEQQKDVQDPAYEKHRLECHRLAVNAQLLHTVLFAEATQAFPELFGKPLIFIRKGWKVVWREVGEGVHAEQSTEEAPTPPSKLN